MLLSCQSGGSIDNSTCFPKGPNLLLKLLVYSLTQKQRMASTFFGKLLYLHSLPHLRLSAISFLYLFIQVRIPYSPSKGAQKLRMEVYMSHIICNSHLSNSPGNLQFLCLIFPMTSSVAFSSLAFSSIQ